MACAGWENLNGRELALGGLGRGLDRDLRFEDIVYIKDCVKV